MERLPGHTVEQRFDILDLALVLPQLVENLLLGGFEHAIKPARIAGRPRTR